MSKLALHPGPITLYAQLAGILRDQIYCGRWKTGDEIPTLEQLALEYNVARVTVRQAIQMLSAEGLLSSQRGRRTTVTYKVPPLSASPLYSSVGALSDRQEEFSIRLLTVEMLDSLPHRPFSMGRPLGKYTRIRKIDGALGGPYTLSDNFVLNDLYRRFPRGAERRAKIFRLVRDHAEGQVGAGFELIRVSMPNGEEARLLEIHPRFRSRASPGSCWTATTASCCSPPMSIGATGSASSEIFLRCSVSARFTSTRSRVPPTQRSIAAQAVTSGRSCG